MPRNNGKLWLIECKASKTVLPRMAKVLQALSGISNKKQERLILVHRASKDIPASHAIAPGVEALDIQTFAAVLNGKNAEKRKQDYF